jgi:hypothetical protein
MIDFDTVRKLALALPDVEDGTAYGTPCLKLRGTLLTCIAINKSAEPNSLVVRISIDDRNEMIAADSETYYVTDHYVSYPSILVRLSRIRRDALKDLLLMSWKFVSATTAPKRRKRAKRVSR